ncbi:hypothetical protein LuPra_00351 [Luteitalea pratensis]|uniref:Uncharacterized protein n=1 Tax=Luteitalea pratensis TaxID=1855912 RepID=A0A143PHF6_LUTPR|nr:hypothetical protein [Luteitalea pratensis]AMY07184.1 hypothetical protein LuPra_00351 [Luteitalea pratensis]
MSTVQLQASELSSRRRPVPVLILALALVAAGGLWTTLQRRAASTRFEAGLVFVAGACDLSPGVARALGGPLTSADCAAIERIARAEVVAAFAGLRVDLNADPAAFWTVHVRAFVPSRSRTLGAAGASLAFGPLGGRGMVGLMPLTGQALRYAPSNASRAEIVAGIGRGVGRSVVHEFAHQIAGGQIDSTDASTYEYNSVDRPAQYYGALHWGDAGTRVRSRLGR